MRIVDHLGLPAPLLRALEAHKYQKGDADFSVTELNTPAYLRKLRIDHDDEIEIEAHDRLFALMGSMMHSVLEEARLSGMGSVEDRFQEALEKVGMSNPGFYSDTKWVTIKSAMAELNHVLWEQHSEMDHLIFERRLFGEFFGKKISGQVDLIDLNQKLISDYKSCSYWTAIYGAKEEWTQQLNVYKLLAQQNGIEVDRLQIVAWFRDWSKRQAKFKADYPANPVHLFEIEVWPESRTLEFIKNRIAAFEDPNPPVCSKSERWERGGEWAVEKSGRKSALRVLPTQHEANAWVAAHISPGEQLHVVERPAEPVRCLDYCEVKKFCSFGSRL